MSATRKLYLQDQQLFTAKATILESGEREEDEKKFLILDQSIFYPQGGGQPWDKGYIKTEQGIFKVDEVRIIDDRIYHFGKAEPRSAEFSGEAILQIDESRRTLLSKIHSAGHLLDLAVDNIGDQMLVPSKGYHFEEGSYVEYEGLIPPEKREQILNALQEEMNRLQQINMEISTMMITKDQVFEYCHRKADYLRDDEPVRLVMIGGLSACPCGGTHMGNTSELPPIKIYKLKSKSGITRISYSLLDQ